MSGSYWSENNISSAQISYGTPCPLLFAWLLLRMKELLCQSSAENHLQKLQWYWTSLWNMYCQVALQKNHQAEADAGGSRAQKVRERKK